jgi:nitrogen fixation/metabolism regulation signal transduction histidine kinase
MPRLPPRQKLAPRSWPQKLAEAAKATWLYNAQRSTTVTHREFRTRGKPTGAGVEVRDSGTGLDSAALDRLFDAFYTNRPDGMGMGLTISRTIIEAHGGAAMGYAQCSPGCHIPVHAAD